MKKTNILLLGLLFFCATIIAQVQVLGPGGVPGIRVWMQPTLASDTLFKERVKWIDLGSESAKLCLLGQHVANSGIEYEIESKWVQYFNFNLAIPLSIKGKDLELFLRNTALWQSTIFSVWAPDDGFDSDHVLYTLNEETADGIIMTKSHVFHNEQSGRVSPFTYGTMAGTGKDLLFHHKESIEPNFNVFKERSLRILTDIRTISRSASIWGEPHSSITLGSGYGGNSSSFSSDQIPDMAFYGFTPEFIIYNRRLTPLERIKVESYLAIKYGLTLDTNYIGSNGDTLWNTGQNHIYNNRITGYMRDDISGLYQTKATTSYEEEPYFNYRYSSYQTDPYYKSARHKLLVFGKQKGSPIEDGQYLLMGDNGDSTSVSDSITVPGMRIMNRRWLVNTNQPNVAEADKIVEWDNVRNLTMHEKDKFIGTITKTALTFNMDGSAVTKTTLKGRDGYFSWVTGSYTGRITVKFGSNNPNPTAGVNDYGYYFDNNGDVYSITRGIRSSNVVVNIVSDTTQKVEIEKMGNCIVLHINGHKIRHSQIEIDSQDVSSQFHGSILIENGNTSDIVMSNFQQGGFAYTGDWIELSYLSERAENFNNYRFIGKTYLIIDRSGTGNFPSNNIEIIPSADIDGHRSKIIFNNIFWNDNGQGKEVFTFGYKQTDFSIDTILIEHPTCDKGVPQSDGTITFIGKNGIEGFEYRLNLPEQWQRSGIFYGDTLRLRNLAAGEYALIIKEIGGNNFSNIGNNIARAISTTCIDTTNIWVEWSIAGIHTKAIVGISVNNDMNILPDYGVYIKGDSLYREDGSTFLSLLDSTSSRIRMERNRDSLRLILLGSNGEQIFSRGIATINNSTCYYVKLFLDNDSSSIYNLKANGFTGFTQWNTNNIHMDYSSGDLTNYIVRLESPCGNNSTKKTSGNNMIVYNKNLNDRSHVTVSITLEKPSSGQLLVYDVLGKEINSVSLANHVEQQELDITLPARGVYFIVVRTKDWQDTKQCIN